jgi:hypothetical protein
VTRAFQPPQDSPGEPFTALAGIAAES